MGPQNPAQSKIGVLRFTAVTYIQGREIVITQLPKRLVRHLLERAGYRVCHRSVLPFGTEYMLDIERLSRSWRLPIRSFFDVGANEGQTSMSALASFPEARVFAFEPHPQTYSRLIERVAGHSRLSKHNIALSNKSGSSPFFEYGSSTLNSLIPDAQYPIQRGLTARIIEVDCATLDGFCNEHDIQTIDVLKIDAEGCELVVLQGARRMLSTEKIRFIYAEFNDMLPRPKMTGGALTPIADYLAPFGFRFVATYFDHMELGNDMHVGSNALFVRPPAIAAHVGVEIGE